MRVTERWLYNFDSNKITVFEYNGCLYSAVVMLNGEDETEHRFLTSPLFVSKEDVLSWLNLKIGVVIDGIG